MLNVDERHEELEVGQLQRGCDKSWEFHLNALDHKL